MKKLVIWRREVIARTKWREWRYKKETQFAIYYGGKLIAKNSDFTPENKSIRIPFDKWIETMSKNKLECLIGFYGRHRDGDSCWLVDNLSKVIEEVK